MDELGIPYRVVDTGHTEELFPPGLKGGEIASVAENVGSLLFEFWDTDAVVAGYCDLLSLLRV